MYIVVPTSILKLCCQLKIVSLKIPPQQKITNIFLLKIILTTYLVTMKYIYENTNFDPSISTVDESLILIIPLWPSQIGPGLHGNRQSVFDITINCYIQEKSPTTELVPI